MSPDDDLSVVLILVGRYGGFCESVDERKIPYTHIKLCRQKEYYHLFLRTARDGVYIETDSSM